MADRRPTTQSQTLFVQRGGGIPLDGRTYVLVNQWGARTLEAVKVLAEKSPQLRISIKASD